MPEHSTAVRTLFTDHGTFLGSWQNKVFDPAAGRSVHKFVLVCLTDGSTHDFDSDEAARQFAKSYVPNEQN